MPTYQAKWNIEIIAESTEIVIVENNPYFPLDSVNKAFLKQSSHTSTCPWKGLANYYTIDVDGKENQNAAWYYPEPKEAAKEIKDRVAFWKGVNVEKISG